MAELRWGAATHTGQVRAANEDNLHASERLFVVADGMGGHEAGEVASELAVERIRDVLDTDETSPSAESVVDAITNANGDIFRAAIANPGQAGMGTTVTAIAVIADPMAGRGAPNIDDNDGVPAERITPGVPREAPEARVLANVGDSRTYLYRHGRLRRVTVDHNYVQELVSAGHITDDEARTHPRRNIITRALGIEPDVKVDWWTLPLVRGDRFLLCSDGLVDEVTDGDITATLASIDDPQTAVDQLVDQANAAGGRDNISVIVVDVLDGDDPPDPTQELDLTPTWADDAPALTPDEIERIESGLTRNATVEAEPTDEVAVAELSRRQRRKARKAAKRADKQARRDDATDSATESAPDDAATDATDRATAADDADATPADDVTDSLDTDTTSNSDTSDDDTSDEADGESAAKKSDTKADSSSAKDAPKKRTGMRLGRVIAVFVILAVLTSGFVALAAWARSGYFVDFDEDDRVVVFQGRPGGVLWFDPTADTPASVFRDVLTADSEATVDDQPTFSSKAGAVDFVRALDVADAGDDAGSDDAADEDAADEDAADDGTSDDTDQ